MAEDNEPFGEIGRAGQQASDASSRAKRYSDRQGATGESVKFLKESADLQQKLVSLLADEAALIEQIKDGKKSLVDLAKLEEGKEDLILKSKQNQNILSGVGTMASKQQNKAMDSVLSSVNKIKGITEKDVGLNKVKNSLLGKAELNMGTLSSLTGGLAPKALNPLYGKVELVAIPEKILGESYFSHQCHTPEGFMGSSIGKNRPAEATYPKVSSPIEEGIEFSKVDACQETGPLNPVLS